jgi:hypothetical protein
MQCFNYCISTDTREEPATVTYASHQEQGSKTKLRKQYIMLIRIIISRINYSKRLEQTYYSYCNRNFNYILMTTHYISLITIKLFCLMMKNTYQSLLCDLCCSLSL